MLPERYTVELCQAQGIVPETLELFRHWEKGMSGPELRDLALENDILGKATERRVSNVVKEGFANRFLSPGALSAATSIKRLVDQEADSVLLREIFLLYTMRRNLILRDFLCDVYWPDFSAGRDYVDRDDVFRLIDRATVSGVIPKRWSEKTRERVGGYVLGTAHDFRLVGKPEGRGGKRRIEIFHPKEETLLYLAYDLHFSELSESQVLKHPDWMALGYSPDDVRPVLDQLMRSGHLIYQDAGDLVRVDWKYQNREELTDAILGSNY